MADELDDLFGAFDGDGADSSESQKEPEVKRTRLDAEQGTPEDAESNGKENAAGTSTDAATLDGAATKGTKSAFANIMAQKTSSTVPNDPTDPSGPAGASTEKKPDVDDAKREISTGTSHDKTVRSYSSYPKNLPPGHKLATVEPPDEPAKVYKFKLDPFQAQAIGYIDREESVLVAAHTSAGKTAVAEYAIAKSLKNGQKVVYTSPIKALSNRKYPNFNG